MIDANTAGRVRLYLPALLFALFLLLGPLALHSRTAEALKCAACPQHVSNASHFGVQRCEHTREHTRPRQRRYLTVISCWERLGGAVLSFGQVMRMAEMFEFDLVLPPVANSEIGAYMLPAYGQATERGQLFESYFDVGRLGDTFQHFARIPSYREGISFEFRPDDIVIFKVANDACSRAERLLRYRAAAQHTPLMNWTVHCLPVPTNIQELEAAFDAICVAKERCSIAIYEWRKHWVPQLLAPKHHRRLWSSFHRDVKDLAREVAARQNTSTPYVAVQFRSGWFFRYIDMNRDAGAITASFRSRTREMHECLETVVRTAMGLQEKHEADRVYIASDIFGTIPEKFRDAVYQNMRDTALADAREYLAGFRSLRPAPALEANAFNQTRLDPHTLASMIDVQITLDSAELVTIADSGVYSGLTAETKRLAGGRVRDIACNRTG